MSKVRLPANASWDKIREVARERNIDVSGFGSEANQLGWAVNGRRFYSWETDKAVKYLRGVLQRSPKPASKMTV